jgi:hypothetical protein
MEEIIKTRQEHLNTVVTTMVAIEKSYNEICLKPEKTEEEKTNEEKLKTRLAELKELKNNALAALKEAKDDFLASDPQAANHVGTALDKELRKLAQQENVLKGMLTRKPESLSFDSTKKDPLSFIEEFGKFVSRECPTPPLMKAFMLLLLNACTKDDPKAHAFIESFNVEGPPETLEDLKKKFMIFYTGKVYLGSQLPRLASIAMGKEKPGDYCSRIAMVCTGSGIDIGERSSKVRQYLETWFANLPSQEQNNLQGDFSKLPADASVQDYLNLIIQLIPQEPGYIRKQNIHCPYCSALVQWDCAECPTGVLLTRKDKGLKRSTDDTKGSPAKRFKRDHQNGTYKNSQW